jgi:hypothetical protein
MEKTRITNLRKGKCRFLGVDFFVRPTTDKYGKPTKTIKKKKTYLPRSHRRTFGETEGIWFCKKE